jgi:hypothetical protein
MKKYKYLFANGCSFVLGRSTGTVDTKDDNAFVSMEHRFSAILAKKLGCEDINLGSGNSSNNKIVRRTYEWVNENSDKCKDTLVVLGTSQFYRDIKEPHVNWPEFVKHSSEIKFNIIEDLEMKKQTITFELLIYYLKSHGCDVIYFNSFDNFNLSALHFKFDDENLSWRDWLIKTQGESTGMGVWPRKFPARPDGWYGMDGQHPGRKAHQKLADGLYETIKTLL